jgi:hypothetical protein
MSDTVLTPGFPEEVELKFSIPVDEAKASSGQLSAGQ